MRLDLFLKRAGLVKRRTLAARLCRNGYVTLNGRPAPPGRGVAAGDHIGVRFARREVLVVVEHLPSRGGGSDRPFRVVRETRIQEDPL